MITEYKSTNPWFIDPNICPISFTCTITRSVTPTFTYPKCPPPSDSSTFSSLSSTGVFTFGTIDKVTYPPGLYTVLIFGKVGTLSKSATMRISLIDPCPTTTLTFTDPVPYVNYTYYLNDPVKEFTTTSTKLINKSTPVDCGAYSIVFFNSVDKSPVDSAIFDV